MPLIIAILLLIALIFGLKLGENCAFMQRSKFCSVGAISKIFERDFSMLYGVISIIVRASITNLVLNQYKFGFEAQFFVLGMGAGAAKSHNFVFESSGAGITPFAPYAVATLISTLFTLNFHQKSVIKFGCSCRFFAYKF